jgi:aldose 1-epimerase
MAFETKIIGAGKEAIIKLADTSSNCTAEIFAFGAILNRFTLLHNGEEINVIDGFEDVREAPETITPAFKSAKLSPFVCRINEGKYEFANQPYELAKYSMGKNAIHGLVYDEVFKIAETSSEESARVKLQYQYDNTSHGYPFKFSCEVVYDLLPGNTLSVTSSIKNLDTKEIPVADGWHPYFTLVDSVNECEFMLKSNEMLEFDDELIPTGKYIPYKEFNELKKFGTTWFDNCFTVNFEEGQPSCIFRNPNKNIEVQIHPSTSYPYLQFFTPDHRKSIAIENLSAAPDAFNNGIGLKVLAPQECASFNTKYVINPL